MIILSCATEPEQEMTQTTQILIQVYLRDILGSVPDCSNKVNLVIKKQVVIFLLGWSCLQFIKNNDYVL